MDTAEKIVLFCFLLQGGFCRHFNIALPEKIQALSGSCVIIKCRFEIEDRYDTDLTSEVIAKGAWLKDGHHQGNEVFNSSNPKSNHFKGNLTGKLHDKDCTTIFYNVSSTHNGTYYFRIVSGDLKYTYTANTSSINVIDSPEPPLVRAHVDEKDLQDDQEVLEGSSVSLRCSAETLCSSPPPTLTWSSTPRIPLSESSRRQELISDLNFTAAHRHHTLTFTCTVTYQIQERNATAQSNFTLRVQSKNPYSSVLIGVGVVSLVVLMLCVIAYIFIRKKKTPLLQTRGKSAIGSISTNEVDPQKNTADSVYANKDMLSSAGASTDYPEPLIYSSIDFTNSNPRSQEVESVSSLHVDYAVVQRCSGEGTKTKTKSSM